MGRAVCISVIIRIDRVTLRLLCRAFREHGIISLMHPALTAVCAGSTGSAGHPLTVCAGQVFPIHFI